MFTSIIIWFFERAVWKRHKKAVESVTAFYQNMAKEDFKVKEKIVRVKKGKIKYNLVFLQTPKGFIKLQMSRHL